MSPADLETKLRDCHEETFAWSLLCCGGNRHEAEEVLQDTYLRLLDGRLSFGRRSSFKTWLFSVIRRAARDRQRRRAAQRVLRGRWFRPAESPTATQERHTLERERSRQIRRLMGELSGRQREVLELVFFHDLALREAAIVLGISNGSASRHYHRGKRALLARCEEAGIEV